MLYILISIWDPQSFWYSHSSRYIMVYLNILKNIYHLIHNSRLTFFFPAFVSDEKSVVRLKFLPLFIKSFPPPLASLLRFSLYPWFSLCLSCLRFIDFGYMCVFFFVCLFWSVCLCFHQIWKSVSHYFFTSIFLKSLLFLLHCFPGTLVTCIMFDH